MSSSEEGVEKTSQITGGIIFGYICTTKIACKDKYPLITIALKLFELMQRYCQYYLTVVNYGIMYWIQSWRQQKCKYILNLPPSATNMAVCGELGQLPLHLPWRERILSYWNRLCSEERFERGLSSIHLDASNR